MSDADTVLSSIFISSFTVVGVCACTYWIRNRRRNISMKKSASMEELSSVETHDPTQTQDEERYALPPTLEPKVLRHMGSSSLQTR